MKEGDYTKSKCNLEEHDGLPLHRYNLAAIVSQRPYFTIYSKLLHERKT